LDHYFKTILAWIIAGSNLKIKKDKFWLWKTQYVLWWKSVTKNENERQKFRKNCKICSSGKKVWQNMKKVWLKLRKCSKTLYESWQHYKEQQKCLTCGRKRNCGILWKSVAKMSNIKEYCCQKSVKTNDKEKTSPVVNFINILCTNFLYEHCLSSFFYVYVTSKKLLKHC